MASPRHQSQLWTPFALGRPVLFGFAVLFALLAISFGTVFSFSDKDHGLATPSTRLRYLWTYCPSTFFIVVSGLWMLVYHHTRSLAPWQALAHRPTPASRSLLIDYISLNQYIALFRSSKNRHWKVTLAAAGVICLDILIVLSTGLFIVQPISWVNSNYNVSMATKFNSSGIVDVQKGGSLARAYAISAYGVSLPIGTTPNFAYATVDDSSISPNETVQVQVDAAWSGVSCETVDASWSFGLISVNSTYNGTLGGEISITSKNCSTKYRAALLEPNQTTNYLFATLSLQCSQTENYNISNRFAVLAAELNLTDLNITATQLETGNASRESVNSAGTTFFLPLPQKVISSKAAAVMCTIQPRLRSASLLVTQGSSFPTLLDQSTPVENIPIIGRTDNFNFSFESQIQRAIPLQLEGAGPYLGSAGYSRLLAPLSSVSRWTVIAPFFQMLNQSEPRPNIGDMIDSNYLLNTSSSAIQLIASQILLDTFFPTSNNQITGQQFLMANRLTVSPLILGLIILALVLMIIFSVALGTRSHGSTPKEPNSIASRAIILAASPDVIDFVRYKKNHETFCPYRHEKQEFRALSTHEFGGTRFRIEEQTMTNSDCVCGAKDSSSVVPMWWRPWSSSIVCHVLAILLPCVAIGLLEGLYRQSKAHQGIANVISGSFVHHAWVYVPVIVVVLLNTIFIAVSSANRIIQPYVAMRQRPRQASEALGIDLTNKTAVGAMWLAVKLKYFGTSATIFATILGAALPIVISGLYRVQDVQYLRTLSLKQTSGFDPSLSISTLNTANGYPVPGFILNQNLSYPKFTYGQYALPAVGFVDPALSGDKSDIPGQSTINFELPAILGDANCTLLETDQYKFFTLPKSSSIGFNLTMGNGCPALFLNASLATPFNNFLLSNWLGTSRGFRPAGLISPENPAQNASLATYHGPLGVPPHCPLDVALMAKGIYNSNSLNFTDTMVFACSPYVAQENLNVTFSVPMFDISPMQPPVTVPNTRSFFSEAELWTGDFFFQFLPDHYTNLPGPNTTGMVILDPKLPGLSADPFFQTVYGGVNGILPSSLLQPDNKTFIKTDAMIKKVQDRIQDVYGTTVAQIYNGKQRFSATSQSYNANFQGTLASPAGTRVVQDEVSTRILQAILAAMAVCAVTTVFMVNGRRLLPENPCSIASSAQLLAHSSILNPDVIPLGSEMLNGEELKKRGVLEHYLYSLGWWGSGEKARYGIDIGRAEKEG